MKKPKNLRTIYSVVFIGMGMLLITIVTLIAGWQSSQNLREVSGKSLTVTAESMGDQLDQHMWARFGEVEILSQLEPFRNPTNIDRTRELINQFKAIFPMFSWIGLTDSKGTVLASTDGILEGASIAERPVYLEAQDGPFIGDVHEAILLAELLPNPTGEVMQFVDISLPLNEQAPSPVLATHLSWEWAAGVEQQVMEPLEADKGIELFVVSARDQIILLGPEHWVGKAMPDAVQRITSSEWQEIDWGREGNYVTASVDTDGYLDYEGLGWTVVARQPTSIAYQSANELVNILILSGIFLAVLAGIIGRFFASRLSRPIQELSRAADQLSLDGRNTIPVQSGIAEFESLSFSLNNMIERLRDTSRRLGKMEQMAVRDFLTGLPNRRALDRIENADFDYVFYMDLDGFKQVNDILGHHAGDELLIQLAERANQFIRDEEKFARAGGDEFIYLVKGSRDDSEARVRKLMDIISEPYIIEGTQAVVGVSAGGCRLEQGQSFESALMNADTMLYEVKQNGKHDVRFFVSGTSKM